MLSHPFLSLLSPNQCLPWCCISIITINFESIFFALPPFLISEGLCCGWPLSLLESQPWNPLESQPSCSLLRQRWLLPQVFHGLFLLCQTPQFWKWCRVQFSLSFFYLPSFLRSWVTLFRPLVLNTIWTLIVSTAAFQCLYLRKFAKLICASMYSSVYSE